MGPNSSGKCVGLPYLQPSKMMIFMMANTFCEKKKMKQGGEVGIDIYWVLTIFEPTQKWRVQRNTNSSTKKRSSSNVNPRAPSGYEMPTAISTLWNWKSIRMREFISAKKNQTTCMSLLVFPILYQGSCSIPWKAAVAQVSYEAASGQSPESHTSSLLSPSSTSPPSSPSSPSSSSAYHHYNPHHPHRHHHHRHRYVVCTSTTPPPIHHDHTITLVIQTWAGSWQTKGWSFLQITSSHSGLNWDHDHWPLTKYKLQILNKSCLHR